MLNKKGQGLTEYGIILLLILLVGGFVWFNTDIKDSSSSMYSTISSKLKSIIGIQENNYDTDNKYSKNLNRKTPTYLTTLKLANGKTILWRNEGGKYDSNTKTYTIDPNLKVYTIDNNNDFGSGGTLGLMIDSYRGVRVNNGPPTYFDGKYASAGYTYDANAKCTTTYFRGSDNQIYIIRDYGDTNTTMTNYTGSDSDTVTAYYDSAKTSSKSTTVGALADARTKAIETQKW